MRFLNILTAPTAAVMMAVPAAADSLLWEVKSEHPNIVSLEFYSQDRDHAWPGDDDVYIIDDYETHSYNLQCRSGEKICLGAWLRGHSDVYWGVGFDDREDCRGCCYICGEGDTGLQLLNE